MSDQLSSIKVLDCIKSDTALVYVVVPALVPVISNVILSYQAAQEYTERIVNAFVAAFLIAIGLPNPSKARYAGLTTPVR